MRLCVLQPDYTGSAAAYGNYDPRRDLTPLMPPGWQVDHLFLRKATVYGQLRRSAAERGYDIYVNLCEGYLDWDIPSLDVIWCLEALNLPYTGPSPRLYDPSKPVMKIAALAAGVATPNWVPPLRFPLFVKPAHAGDSLGIDDSSLVTDETELERKRAQIRAEFGEALVEEYIEGREFTVLVAAAGSGPIALTPVEFRFPPGRSFKTYRLKVEEHHPECNLPVVADSELASRLKQKALAVFAAFEGEGYARIDFRLDAAGELWFLDINFACSIFYPAGYEGSADYILRYDPLGPAGFLRHIVSEGIDRHRRRQRAWRQGVAAGPPPVPALFAARDIAAGETVHGGEGALHRVVTDPESGLLRVQPSADPAERLTLRAVPPPNAAWRGLDLIALRDIRADEELTAG
jgi:D-alanine-D-alanine ligase